MKAVILAAGVGSRLAPLTNDRPKALVAVLGKPILFRHLDSLARAGIPERDVIVVGGYKIDVLRRALATGGHPEVTVVENDRFAPWNNFWSLYVAEAAVAGHDFLQIDGDALLDDVILPRMIEATGEALLAVDCREQLDDETMKVQLKDDSEPGHDSAQAPSRSVGPGEAAGRDLSQTRSPHLRFGSRQVLAVSKKLAAGDCVGEYIGVTKLTAAAAHQVFRELEVLRDLGLTHEYYEHAYHRLTGRDQVRFGIVDVHDCTVTEIDDVADLERAEAMLRTLEAR